MASQVQTTEKPRWHRNLFSKTLVGRKRERQSTGYQVPFRFTIDVSPVPPPTVPPTPFVPLPDTYLLLNVPSDVAGVVITGSTLSLPSHSSSDAAATVPPLDVSLQVYVLDSNRRAQQKPVSVASLNTSDRFNAKLNVPLNAGTSVMLSPIAGNKAALEKMGGVGAAQKQQRLAVSVWGYVIDDEAQQTDGKEDDAMSVTVKRFLQKMERQSSIRHE